MADFCIISWEKVHLAPLKKELDNAKENPIIVNVVDLNVNIVRPILINITITI